MFSDEPFIYRVNYFEPGPKDHPMSMWILGTSISSDIAKKAFATKLNDKAQRHFEDYGKACLRGHRLKDSFTYPYHFYENTAMLYYVEVPGVNCASLGLHWEGISPLVEGRQGDNHLEYTTHNVDSMAQGAACLSLWLYWANHVVDIIKLS